MSMAGVVATPPFPRMTDFAYDASRLSLQPPVSAETVVSIRRNTLIAIIGSLLLHLALLFTPKAPPLKPGAERPVVDTPFTIDLAPPQKKSGLTAQPANPAPAAAAVPAPTPPRRQTHTVRRPPLPPVQSPLVLPAPPQAPPPPASKPAPTLPPDAPQATDMASYVAAMRARKEAAARQAAGYDAAPPSAEAARDAAIARNLQSGTQGTLTILARDSRSIRFTFRYRPSMFSSLMQETRSIEIAPGEDLLKAFAHAVAQLIHQHYSDDFNWERMSGPSVSLSARPGDSAALEEFIRREFASLEQDDMPPMPSRSRRP